MAEQELNPIVSENGRYYYKAKDGKGYLNLKSPLDEAKLEKYVQITEEEFNRLTYVAPHEPTEEEIARKEKLARIAELKRLLAASDYEAIKYAEGWFTEQEYAPYKAQRQAYRDEINELEAEVE